MPASAMPELTPKQIAALEQLLGQGFQPLTLPLYERTIVIRKENCAALLEPLENGAFRVIVEPSYLLDGNLSVRITRVGKEWFVWKRIKLEATPERLQELAGFRREIETLLKEQA